MFAEPRKILEDFRSPPKHHQLRPCSFSSTLGTPTPLVPAPSRALHHLLQQLAFSKTGLNKARNLWLWQLPSSACQGWNTRWISSNPALDWPAYWLVAVARYTCQGVCTHAEYARRAPDETVHQHLHFQGKAFALNQTTHIALNMHDKKAINFLLIIFFLLTVIGSYPTIKYIRQSSSNDNTKHESVMSTGIAMNMQTTLHGFP